MQNPTKPILLDPACAEQRVDIHNLQTSLCQLNKDVHLDTNARRQRAIKAHNRATNIVLPRFDVGDFMIVRQPDHRTMHKLSFRWVGPRRIANTVSPLVYFVEHLDGGRRE